MRTVILVGAFCAWLPAVSQADLYQWTDTEGVTHIVDESVEIPEAYRSGVTVYRAAKPAGETPTVPLSPSRTYAAQSQGAFAQKLALDLGLVKNGNEDALGPLRGTGIQPTGGWKVDEPLTPEVLYEVLAAARRAANTKRLAVSADGAEAVVRQAAEAFLPKPPITETPGSPSEPLDDEALYDEEPVVIIEQAPPQIVEVIQEPIYDYVPAPFVYGFSGIPRRHHHGHRPDNRPLPPSAPLTGPFTPNPAGVPGGLTHMPFGASHMPFGSSRAR